MRQAKKKIDKAELFYEILDALGISVGEIHLPCPIPSFPDKQSIRFCTNKCFTPCKTFTQFQFVTLNCANLVCEDSSPCAKCLDRIEAYKMLMKCIRVLFPEDEKAIGRRCKSHIVHREKYYKRLQKGKRKKQRERQKWKDRKDEDG